MKMFCSTALAAALTMSCLRGASAQAQPPPSITGAAAPQATVTPAMLHIPEGTEIRIRFEEPLSSGSATVGDRFTVSSAEPVQLSNGATLPAGFKGVGEVTAASKRGMMGKGGELSVRLDYLKVGGQRVHLRGSQGGSGNGAVGTTVALTVLFGPLGLLKHGHDMQIPKGQVLTAYVDQDIDLALPLPAPDIAG